MSVEGTNRVEFPQNFESVADSRVDFFSLSASVVCCQ